MDKNQIQTSIEEAPSSKSQIIYRIEQFEGPLDLLLSLIAKNKMSIEDIQISVICDQYMEYLNTMQVLNIEVSSEFIVMASELMYIKSKILLPRIDEEEEDPRERLALALLEYKRAKEASQMLNDMYSVYGGRMVKDTDEISADRSYVAEHSVNLLSKALMKVMSNIYVTDEEVKEKIKPLISHKTVSVTERVYSVLRLLLTRNGLVNALECFSDTSSIHEIVATFMAILEMLKAGRISIMEDVDSVQKNGIVDIGDNIFIKLYPGKIRNAEVEQNG